MSFIFCDLRERLFCKRKKYITMSCKISTVFFVHVWSDGLDFLSRTIEYIQIDGNFRGLVASLLGLISNGTWLRECQLHESSQGSPSWQKQIFLATEVAFSHISLAGQVAAKPWHFRQPSLTKKEHRRVLSSPEVSMSALLRTRGAEIGRPRPRIKLSGC